MKTIQPCLLAVAPLFVAACLLPGCGAGYGEVPVSGRVTYDGEPLANVHLSFQPVAQDASGFGPGSFGRTNAQGEFELRTVYPDAPGAVPGEHRLTISYEDPSQRPQGVTIPIEYVEGTATFQIPEEGTTSAEIALSSKK